MPATRHVFAYGSLVDPGCLQAVLGHAHRGERLAARLTGYQRIASDAYPFPYIVAAAGHSVDGVLVMDLSPHDLAQLDRYEEVALDVYRRVQVEVAAWGCGPRDLRVSAWVYVAGPRLPLLPEDRTEPCKTESSI